MARPVLALAALASLVPAFAAAAPRAVARALLADGGGRPAGVALLREAPDGVHVALELSGAAGPREVRLERDARCAPPRPSERRIARAALPADPGARLGEVGAGATRARLFAAGQSLSGPASIRGGALVVRDEAGARLACGRITGRAR